MSKTPKPVVRRRDLFDRGVVSSIQNDYESIRRFRKSIKGRPDKYDLCQIRMDKMFESFYKGILNH